MDITKARSNKPQLNKEKELIDSYPFKKKS